MQDPDVDKTTVGVVVPETDSFNPYNAYSSHQRKLIVALVSVTGVISPLSSLLYTPALSTIASELNVSISKVNLTITTYLIFQGIAPPFWGTLADTYGRRLLYIITLLVLVGACIGLSITNSYTVVLILRALQAAGSSSTSALGAGVIRDLFPPNQRGGYLGIYSAGVVAGTAFGPVIGGALAQYAGLHGIFYFLLALSGVTLTIIILFLPETLHSKIPGPSSSLSKWFRRPPVRFLSPNIPKNFALQQVRPNFLGPLRLLIHWDVICCVSFTGICYTVWQNTMVATSTIYANEYNLSQAKIGLTFLSNGVGSLVGNVITGRVLDRHYQDQLRRENCEMPIEKQQVVMIEQARLRSLRVVVPMFIGCIVLLGWILHAHIHIAASIVTAFFIGWFDSSILTTYTTLMVDIFEQQASTSSAIINLVRCLLGAVGTSTIGPMISALGVGWAFSTLAGVCIISSPAAVIQFKYGNIWRSRREFQASSSSHNLAAVTEKDKNHLSNNAKDLNV